MTNGEKYKTAQERADAFAEYCEGRSAVTNDKCLLDAQCRLCNFAWLDLEAEDEKPLPCPYCGGECKVIFNVVKCGCGYTSKVSCTAEEAIAAHNRVAKKCREVKE